MAMATFVHFSCHCDVTLLTSILTFPSMIMCTMLRNLFHNVTQYPHSYLGGAIPFNANCCVDYKLTQKKYSECVHIQSHVKTNYVIIFGCIETKIKYFYIQCPTLLLS